MLNPLEDLHHHFAVSVMLGVALSVSSVKNFKWSLIKDSLTGNTLVQHVTTSRSVPFIRATCPEEAASIVRSGYFSRV